MKEKELEKSVKEDQWKKEKLRRETEDRMWDVSSGSLSQGEKSKHDGKKVTENDSKVSLSKLEETILKVQQQMAEGTDHVNFELKMKEQDKHKEEEHKVQKTSEHIRKTPTHHEKGQINPNNSKSHSPKKIKIRVEMEKRHTTPEKIDKKVAANTVVSLMVPYFKKGRIASRDVFKCCAKEFTTLMLDFKLTNDPTEKKIPLSRYTKYVDNFFVKSGNISSEGELKTKLAEFKKSLEVNQLL